jgi:hypothetical protein
MTADLTAARGALVAAAVSGVLYAAGAFVPQVDGPPVETATADQIRTFLSDNDTAIRVAAAGSALAMVLILVFTVSLARLIRLREPGSAFADLVLGGGILVALWHWVMVAGTSSTLVQELDGTDLATVDDATLRGWYGLTNFAHLFGDLGMIGMVAVVGGASVAALRSGLVARWTAWLGLVITTCGLLGTLGITLAASALSNFWFGGIFGWFLWILVVGLTCARRAMRSRAVDVIPSVSADTA